MKVNDRVLWSILCVIIIILLVLAATLLSRPGAAGQGLWPKGAAALTAGVVGGTALRLGASAHKFLGGGKSDLDPKSIAAGETALKFPADQTAKGGKDIQKEHHAVRVALVDAVNKFEAEKSAMPPKKWDAEELQVKSLQALYGSLCDVVRGRFDYIPELNGVDLPGAPWNNSEYPGPSGTTRLGRWLYLRKRMGDAAQSLRDSVQTMRCSAEFDALVRLINDMNQPNIAMPPPIDPSSLAAASMFPTKVYTRDGSKGNLIKEYRDSLINLTLVYKKQGLRSRANINVDMLDKQIAAVMANSIRLYQQYVDPGAASAIDLAALRANVKALGVSVRDSLKNAYKVLARGVGAGIKNESDYTTAMKAAEVVSVTLGKLASAGLPLPKRFVRPQKHQAAVPDTVSVAAKRFIIDTRRATGDMVRAYMACRSIGEIEFKDADDLVYNLEDAVEELYDCYANLSFDSKKAAYQVASLFDVAVKALGDALANDARLANSPPSITKDTFIGLFNAVGQALATFVAPDPRNPADLPPANAAIGEAMLDRRYDRAEGDLKMVATLARAIASTKQIKLPSVRVHYRALHIAWLIDPSDNQYTAVETALVDFANHCAEYVSRPSSDAAIAAEGKRAELNAALQTIAAQVNGEALVHPQYKASFNSSVRRAIDLLGKVPNLEEMVDADTSGYAVGAEAPRPTESQLLLHYASPPKDTVRFVKDPAAPPAGEAADIVIEASSLAELQEKIKKLPSSGLRMVYGLVTDKPGDMTALYKAVGISLKLGVPPEIAAKVADRKKSATGWLYDVLRFEAGEPYVSLREYVRPEMYAVDI